MTDAWKTREQIARIIAPKKWADSDSRGDGRGHPIILQGINEKELAASLKKADAIIKLFKR